MANILLVPDTTAFLVPCDFETFCCGRTPFEDCCDSGMLIEIEGINYVYAKYLFDEEEEDSPRYSHQFTGTDSYTTQDMTSTVTSQATTTITDAVTPVAGEVEEMNKRAATKLIAIGVGLGLGGAILVSAVGLLVRRYIKKNRKRNDEIAALAVKSAPGSEEQGPSTINTPTETSQYNLFATIPSSNNPTINTSQSNGYPNTLSPGNSQDSDLRLEENPRPISPNPPAPPYSPPQYDAGEYQYLVVDGPMPSHTSMTGLNRSGGLPVDADGKPRLED